MVEKLEDRRLLALVLWDGDAGDGLWSTPRNWSTDETPTSNDDVFIGGSFGTIRVAASPESVRSIVNNATLSIESDLFSNTMLATNDAFTNHGTIELRSTRNDRTSSITVNDGLLTNSPTGVIHVSAANGGGRSIVGSVLNQGEIFVESGIGLSVSNQESTFTQADGLINAEGWLSVNAGTFSFTGGTLQGTFNTVNSVNSVESSVDDASLFNVYGTSSALVNHLSPQVTLRLQTDVNHNTTLTPLEGAVNAGIIELSSTRNDRTSTIQAVHGFSNTASGVIRSMVAGAGGRALRGHVTNQGLISVEDGAYLDFIGKYSAAGGTSSGNFYLVNSQIEVTASPQFPAEILMFGNNTLLTDILDNTTLALVTNASYNTTLLSEGGFTNHGTIELRSTRNDRTSSITLNNGLLTNSSTGVIHVSAANGGGRSIVGSVLNQGEIFVESGIGLSVSNQESKFTQADGLINAEGWLSVNAGTFSFTGGALQGTFNTINSVNSIESSVDDASLFNVYGTSSTLVNHLSPQVTLRLQTDATYNTTLTPLEGAVNAGIIELSSTRFDRTSTIQAVHGFTNTASGVIRSMKAGAGGRALRGHMTNQGLISVEEGAYLDFVGRYTAAGGTSSGNFYLVNSQIEVTPSEIPAQILMYGNSTLLTDNLNNTTLVLVTNGTHNTTLLSEGGFTNHGTIELRSTRNDRTSSIKVNDGLLTNSPTGVIHVSAANGGGRSIVGSVLNKGEIFVESGIGLNVSNQESTFSQADGLVNAEGWLSVNEGTFSFTGGETRGSVNTINSANSVASSVETESLFSVYGTSSTLVNHLSPQVTLRLQTDATYNTTLTPLEGAVNAGIIELSSTRFDRTSTIQAVHGFTNTASGVIRSMKAGAGGRALRGHMTNQGLISVEEGAYLDFVGRYTAAGGTSSGNFYLVNSQIEVTASPQLPAEILMYGNNVLLTDVLINTTLALMTNKTYNTTLLSEGGFTNHGTIELRSTRFDRFSRLTVNNGLLTNASTGVIHVTAANSGGRSIIGSIANDGTVFVESGIIVHVTASEFSNHFGASISGGGSLIMNGQSIVSATPPVGFTNSGYLDFSLPGVSRLLLDAEAVYVTYYSDHGMDATTVGTVANYQLVASGNDGTFNDGNEIDVTHKLRDAIEYDQSTHVAVLPLTSLLADDRYLLTINGQEITDSNDTALYSGSVEIAAVVANVFPVASLDLSPTSDTGFSSLDKLTNLSSPIFTVKTNRAGVISIDLDGDGIADAVDFDNDASFETFKEVTPSVTYSFSTGDLPDGANLIKVHFVPNIGLPVEDSLTVTIDTSAPLLEIGPSSEQAPAQTRFIQFSEPITTSDDGTTADSLSAVLIGSSGNEVNVRGVSGSGATYTFAFDPIFVPGEYELRFTDQIYDLAGNQILSVPVDTFLMLPDSTAPFVTEFAPLGQTNQNVNRLLITFSEPMDPATLTLAQVGVQVPQGFEPIAVTSVSLVPGSDEQFEILLASPISIPGDYTVTIAASVADLSGNELGASYSAGITIDKTGPRILSAVPVGTLHQVVSFIDVAFDSPIDESTFRNNDVSLVGPAGAVSVSHPWRLSGNTFRIPISPQRANGAYQLTVGPQVLDLAGNPMDQNGNGIAGEPGVDAFTHSFTVSLPNLVVEDSIRITDPSGTEFTQVEFGETFQVGWTTSNAGTFVALGGHQDRAWFSTNTTLSGDDVLLGTFDVDASSSIAAGDDYSGLISAVVPLVSGRPAGTYYLLVQTDASGSLVEANESDNLRAVPIEFVMPALPDLVASDIVLPESIASGATAELSWNVANIGAAMATGPWIERVYLSGDATGTNRQLIASFIRQGNLDSTDAPIARNELVSIPVNSLNGELYFIVEVDSGDAVVELDEQNLFASETTRNLPAVLGLSMSRTSVNEGGSSVEMTVSRNGSVQAPLTVTLSASQAGRLVLPTSVTIPAGQYSRRFSISALDDTVYHEETNVVVTASGNGFPDADRVIQAIDNDLPTLSLSVPSTPLAEGDSVTVTVARDFVSTQDRVLTIAVDNAQQLTAPTTVTLLAGQTSVEFTVTAVDDWLIEPDTFHTISVSAAGHVGDTKPLTIAASDLPTLGLELPSVLTEGAQGPSILGRVTRDPATAIAVDIELTSSDPDQLVVPTTVRIPAGQASVFFPIQVRDDDLVNGDRDLQVTARPLPTAGGAALGAGAVNRSVAILDNDGLALSVTFDRGSVAEGFGATATIGRNSVDLSEEVTVSLSTSPEGQLAVADTAIIPAGASTVTVSVQGIDDDISDGDQIVTLLASAADHLTASGTIVVTDTNLPDLDIVAPTPATLTATTGEMLDLSWTIANSGNMPAVGTWTQRVLISDDAVIGNDTLAAQYTYTGPLAAGDSYDRAVDVRMPNQPGEYWLVLQADVSNTVDELLESNNARITAVPIIVSAAYTATASTDVQTAPADTPVLITGRASNLDGTPAAFKQVSVHLTVRGTRRVLPVITDANGDYSLTFNPLPGEGGRYTIGAAHPGERTAPIQDEFLLVGMRAEPPAQTTSVREGGDTVTGSITIRNLADVPLSELSLQVVGVPDNIMVAAQFRDAATSLSEIGTVVLDYSITALDATNRSPNFQLQVTTLEAPSITVPVNVSVIPLVSRLVADRPRLDASMLVGDQTSVEFTITNDGGIATGLLEVLLPTGADWLSLATSSTMPSLQPGESSSVTLLLTPPENLELTAYNGSLIVRSVDSEVVMPFSFRAVSEQIGGLQVTVTDEYFYFTDEKPLVTNATVRLLDVITGAEIASSVPATSGSALGTLSDSGISVAIDAEGRVSFTGVPKGPYTLEVRSDQHETYSNTVRVESGELKPQQVFISRNLVEYTWTVEEVEIEDRTRITIDAQFETNVPAPVVVVEGVLDFAELTVVGQTQQFDIKITNHGLIEAQDVGLEFGDHPFYEITPLIDNIGVLPAKTEVIVPVIVRRIATFETLNTQQLAFMAGLSESQARSMEHEALMTAAASGPTVTCSIPARVIYFYICGDLMGRVTTIPVINVDGNCPTGTFRGSSSSSSSSSARVTPVAIRALDPCDCVERPIFDVDLSSFFGFIQDGIKTIAGKIPIVNKDKIDVGVSVKGSAEICCYSDGSAGFGASATAGIEVSAPVFQYGIDTGVNSIEAEIAEGVSIVLSGSFFGGVQVAIDGSLSGSYEKGCDEEGCVSAAGMLEVTATGGVQFSASASISGDGLPDWLTIHDLPTDASFEVVGSLVIETGASGELTYECEERWDGNVCFSGLFVEGLLELRANGEVVEKFGLGQLGIGNDPSAPDPSASNRYYFLFPVCLFDEPVDPTGLLTSLDDDLSMFAIPELDELPKGPDEAAITDYLQSMDSEDGVCATVAIQISQDLVLARTAFDATLRLANNSATDSIEQVSIQVVVFDSDGNDVSERFNVSDPLLSFIASVDGSGVLEPGLQAAAKWSIIPSTEAASDSSTTYFVGGALTYTIDGERVNSDFIPVQITVLPQPELTLTYFLQRDVIGDDPHTPEVESSEPFTLAVMVRNEGAGAARDLRIESAQPRIIENEKGLLIDFDITGTRVNGQELNPTLTAQIGNIGPGELAIAEWEMESTLQGLFVEYNATFEHLSGLGDNRFSLIKDVQIRELIRSVEAKQVDGGDGLPDFLVNDLPDPEDLPDTLYLSDGSVAEVSLGQDAVAAATPSIDNLRIDVTAEMDAGWSYLKMDDPSLGNFVLIAVERSDGSTLPLKNFWKTDRTFVGGGLRPVLEDKIHLLDYDSTGSYTFVFSNGDLAGPELVSFSGVTPNPTTQTIDVVDIEFDEPLSLSSFTSDDLSLTKNGEAVAMTGVAIASFGDNAYRVSGLAAYTAEDAVYELAIDLAQLTDKVGNPGIGVESYRWVRGESSPTILSLSGAPSGHTNQIVDFVEVVFSKPIVPASFGLEDISLRQNGDEILDNQVTIAQLGATTYRIGNLSRLISTDAVYQLSVDAAGVQDTAGLSGIGDSVASWTLDATAPQLLAMFDPPTNPRNIVVQRIDVQFSEPIDGASFDVGDLVLVRDGGTINLLAGDPRVTIEDRGDNRYRIGGINWVQAFIADPQIAQFTLTVDASGIRDQAGNAGVGVHASTWTIDLDKPLAPTNLRLSTFTGEITDGRLNSRFATLTGDLVESGLTISVLDLTSNIELARQQIPGRSFSLPIEFPSAGQHRLRVRVVDAAGNVSDTFIDNLFIQEEAPLVESIEGLGKGVTNVPLGDITIRFVTPINPATFTTNALDLRRNGGENLIDSSVSVAPGADEQTFEVRGIGGLASIDGVYALTISLSSIETVSQIAGSEEIIFQWTMDLTPPDSQVDSLPEMSGNQTVILTARGLDPTASLSQPASGIVSYNIFVSKNDEPYTFFQTLPVDSASTTFFGQPGNHYRFYSVARDAAGNIEAAPDEADAVTTIPVAGPASIGDRVWFDANANGTQDLGEVGVQGVLVRLYAATTQALISETTTASDGLYQFSDVDSSVAYFLEFVTPAGFGFTRANASGNSFNDSDANVTTGRTVAFSVNSNANSQWDAGLLRLASISGSAWWDLNGNGQREPNEQILSGHQVFLDLNDNGAHDGEEPAVMTNANGEYLFSELRPGSYTVRYAGAIGWKQTYPNASGTNELSLSRSEIALTMPMFDVAPGLAPNFVRQRLDIDGDGVVTTDDASRVIDFLNESMEWSSGSLIEVGIGHPLDVNGDGLVTPIDVLQVTNAINRGWVVSASLERSVIDSNEVSTRWGADLIGLDRLRADQRFQHFDGSGTTVVVIDTGIDENHPFFGPDLDGNGVSDRILFQYDFADSDSSANDLSGHGSHVTSIIASSDPMFPGIAPNVNIVSLKVLSDSGRGNFADLERALQWVVQNVEDYNIVAVNLSLGDGKNWANPVSRYGISDELSQLDRLGVITVSAAGNSFAVFEGQQGLTYPAADAHSISVGAVWDGDRGFQTFGIFGTDYSTDADRLAAFSQRHGFYLDTLAPGAAITAANAHGGVSTMRGTSMATPFVTGAAVLAQQASLELNGERLTTQQVRELLNRSGVTVFDGDDEDNNVAQTQANYSRVDLVRFMEELILFDTNPDPGLEVPSGGQLDGLIGRASGSDGYRIELQPGEERVDIDFGSEYIGNPSISPWQNPLNRLDVNADGRVSPLDALTGINFLNRRQQSEMPPEYDIPFYDVSGDGSISPIDSLTIINALNRGTFGSGEASYSADSPMYENQVVAKQVDELMAEW